jgi:hypothetical protein
MVYARLGLRRLRLRRELARLWRRKVFLVALVMLGAEILLLARLHYSKAWLQQVSLEQALAPQDPLVLGGLSWHPEQYLGNPRLAPFADLVRRHCSGLGPLETTRCLSDLLAARFPHGSPTEELFDPGFSPTAQLKRHLEGEPGHCVTRSGIIATALLASGIPGRMVQLIGEGKGHNAVEVFDRDKGWIFFDPTYGGEFAETRDGRSAPALRKAGGGLPWIQSSVLPVAVAGAPAVGQLGYSGTSRDLLTGSLVYPEPWLYTRVGSKLAPSPFQATFLVVGERSWQLAFGRRVLYGIILLTLALLVFASLPAFVFVRGLVSGAVRGGRPAEVRRARLSG